MPKRVSDASANRRDKIANAAEVLKKAAQRQKVFSCVYKGKKDKSSSEIRKCCGFNQVRTLQELGNLEAEDMVEKLEEKKNGKFIYRKISFYSKNKNKILKLARNSNKLNSFHTKVNPKKERIEIKLINVPKNIKPKIKFVTIDDIDSFKGIEKIKKSEKGILEISEKEIKNIFKKIIGEKGKFIDWGGEKNDLLTTRLIFKGKRINAAFAFKGKGTKGILTPKKMGLNGDQIQRLFRSEAKIFFIQYVRQISEEILEQMRAFATIKSLHESEQIYYGIIDGQDTERIIRLYSKKRKKIS